jgi:hypothetical protein
MFRREPSDNFFQKRVSLIESTVADAHLKDGRFDQEKDAGSGRDNDLGIYTYDLSIFIVVAEVETVLIFR